MANSGEKEAEQIQNPGTIGLNEGWIRPEDVPTGDTTEDRRTRQEIIKQFYFYWKKHNPDLCRFNENLGENIYINHTSLVETAGRASLTYLSTLAVLQLDAILQNAIVRYVDKPKPGNKQRKPRSSTV